MACLRSAAAPLRLAFLLERQNAFVGVFRLQRLGADKGGEEPETLAPHLTAPTGLALSSDDIFVGDGDAVYRRGKRGCPDTLEPVVTGVTRPSLLAADGRHVYFTERFDAGLWPLRRADVLRRKPLLDILPDTVDPGFVYTVTDEWLVHGRTTGNTIRRFRL